MRLHSSLAALLLLSPFGHAETLVVKNANGDPLARVMVTQSPLAQPAADLSDDGYAPNGVTNTSDPATTRFTNAAGEVSFEPPALPVTYRARAQGYVDA